MPLASIGLVASCLLLAALYQSTTASVPVVSYCLDNDNPLDPSTGSGAQLTSLLFSSYENELFLPTKSDPCKGMAFHWNIVEDGTDSKIQIGVVVKTSSALEGSGWVGFGFSEAGGMRGADIVYYEADSNTIVDSYVGDGYLRPMRDQVSQDWSLVRGEITNDGFLLFEAERDLVAANVEDHDIVNDSSLWVANHRIIGAWGSTSTMSFHLKDVVQRSVQLFSDGPDGTNSGDTYAAFLEQMNERADGHAFLKLDNYTIPTQETTYEDFCFTVNDLVELGLYEDVNSSTHIIGIEWIVDRNIAKYMHHGLLMGQLANYNPDTDSCSKMSTTFAGWTPGSDPLIFPKGTGLEVGNVANSFNAITVQYHFDNIDEDKYIIDSSSGVKIYYTNQKSTIENEIGMATMGDGLLELEGEMIGNGRSKHEISCPSSCSNILFDVGVEEVTVVHEGLHMHAKGKRMVNTLYSEDGKEVHAATGEFYDFDQTGILDVRQNPYSMKRGDYYKTTCYYESYDNTKMGLSSRDEMCMTFLYYYPKQENFVICSPNQVFPPFCEATYEKTMLDASNEFDRSAPSPNFSPEGTANDGKPEGTTNDGKPSNNNGDGRTDAGLSSSSSPVMTITKIAFFSVIVVIANL